MDGQEVKRGSFFFFKNEELKPYVYANKKNLKGKKKYIYEEREHREGC